MLLLGNGSSGGGNGTTAGPAHDPGYDPGYDPGPEAVVVPVVFGLIFVLGLLGNSLVMLVIGKVKPGIGGGRRRPGSPTNVFVVNLSVADLGFLLFCVPFQATVYSLPQWVFGGLVCRGSHYAASVSMLVSIFTLAAMSVDRYVAVVLTPEPRRCRRTRRRALAGVAVIWVVSAAVSVPVAQHQVLLGYPNGTSSSFCWEHWESRAARRGYKVATLLLGYVLPLVLICCCYTRVLVHLHKKMKNISKKSERSKRKTSQTVLLVIAAFTVCWTPHHIITMWAEFGAFPLTDASFAFRILSHCLAYGNSCVNPVLYAFLSENFRKASRQVCSRRCLFPPRPLGGDAVLFRMKNLSNTQSTTRI
ncbi:galanin receptor type 1b [Etheostoma spectabile]|uniref:galanin receptor type 1b n=1 Tax=Etheostoma spectabile TaxID=54343 RepID=UPI0013AFAD87|nr:galanin receptor type 1-like [Etheostoma spectabile]